MGTYAVERHYMAIALAQPQPAARRLQIFLGHADAVDMPMTSPQLVEFVWGLIAAGPAGAPPLWVPTAAQLLILTMIIGGRPNALAWPIPGACFVGRAPPLAFRNFNRQLLALQLIVRILDPKYIQQRTHPLCGPVVLMESFARREPMRYVNYVCGLAENRAGTITIGAVTKGVRLAADSNLLAANPTHTQIAQADYIALASLREEGSWFTYESDYTSRTLQGATTAGTLCTWMREAGYRDVEDCTLNRGRNALAKMVFWQSGRAELGEYFMRENLLQARTKLGQHNVVFLAVASNLAHFVMNDGLRDGPHWQAFGGHWVTLLGLEMAGAAGVQLRLRTWGGETPAAGQVVPWTKIGNWYRGYVCGRP